MAGNSKRVGAVRTSKKGPLVGSGGQGKQGLAARGPTPRAEERPHHPAARRAKAVAKRTSGSSGGSGGSGARGASRTPGAAGKRRPAGANELLVGRNPVAEALRAAIPANALYVAIGIDSDVRITESIKLAGDRGLALLEVSRAELDRMTGGLLHQGIALQVPPFQYTELDELLGRAAAAKTFTPLLVALDGVTDPRNLGAVIRSAVAFGAQGVIVPERRAAGVTAAAWRTSAGHAAHIPIAQVTNLTRSLKSCQQAGLFVVGLDASAPTSIYELANATDPVVVVVGSEGAGLSRLVGATCDLLVSIPMAGAAESLNASVAAAVTLSEIARLRASSSS
jgi:23S rRNA (guanosine2251-2'-O)-methyltransferase